MLSIIFPPLYYGASLARQTRANDVKSQPLPLACSSMKPGRWNIFCVVVDNYGDAGVAWRLARELAVEHGLAVRLFCDRMPTLALIAPDVDPGRDIQNVRGVELRRWDGPAGNDVPGLDGGVIVEMFGCGLPEILLLALTQNAAQPAWINVEYLSAESWVESTHGLGSRHPHLLLVRHFFRSEERRVG